MAPYWSDKLPLTPSSWTCDPQTCSHQGWQRNKVRLRNPNYTRNLSVTKGISKMFKNLTSGYRKSSVKPPGGLNRDRELEGRGGLFNLAINMVSVLHEELECKVKKLKYKKLEVVQLRFENKSELPAGE